MALALNNLKRVDMPLKTKKERFLFQAIQFSQTVLIQFSIRINFVYTVNCQNSSILNNPAWHKCVVYFSKIFKFQAIQFSQTVLI